MEYKASLDTICKVITIGVFILFVVIGQRSVRTIIRAHGSLTPTLVYGGVLLLLVATFVGSYIFSTQEYTLTDSELIINRPIGNRVIKLADITEIRPIVPGEFSGTIRTFGVGGLFGYYGKYYNPQLGNMTWYVTQRDHRILIRTQQGDKIIISPDDMGLVNEVQVKKLAGR